jgi:hypothetical protein
MVMQTKRVQRGRTATSGDKRIQALLNVLNDGQYPRFHSDFVNDSRSLVKNLHTLDEIFRKHPRLLRRDKGQHIEIYQQINRLLSDYTVYPKIMNCFQYGRPNPLGWETTWFWSGDSNKECRIMNAFLTALEIAQSGRIQLLGICEKCETWVFARVPSQKFCSEDCRNKFHSSNEADKKRRAAWAKKNYKLARTLKARASKGV